MRMPVCVLSWWVSVAWLVSVWGAHCVAGWKIFTVFDGAKQSSYWRGFVVVTTKACRRDDKGVSSRRQNPVDTKAKSGCHSSAVQCQYFCRFGTSVVILCVCYAFLLVLRSRKCHVLSAICIPFVPSMSCYLVSAMTNTAKIIKKNDGKWCTYCKKHYICTT